jgi:WD40 repeat protein
MSRRAWVGWFIVGFLALVWPFSLRRECLADVEKQTTGGKARSDCYGDPLPEGALARLGTVRLRHGAYVQHLSFSPDGKALASVGGDHSIRFWDPKTGKEFRRLGGKKVLYTQKVVFSPDGKMLATYSYGQNGSLCLLEMPSGNELLKIPNFGGTSGEDRIAFSADSKVLFLLWNNMVQRFEVPSGNKLPPLEGGGRLTMITASPDGKLIAAALGGYQIFLWDGSTGRRLRQWKDNYGLRSLTFVSGSKFLAGASGFNSGCVWDTRTGKEVRLLGTGFWIAPSPDGKTLAMASGGQIRRWGLSTNKELPRLKGFPNNLGYLCYSPDGAMLAASTQGAIRLWDAVHGKEKFAAMGSQAHLTCVAFSPDGKMVATGGEHRLLRLWDRAGKQLRVFEDKDFAIQAVAFAPGGKIVAAASGNLVRLWDVESGKLVRQFHGNAASIRGLTFSPDGKMLASSGWGSAADRQNINRATRIQFWDVPTGKEIKQILGSVGNPPSNVLAFSSDGKLLIWGDDWVHLTELDSGEDLLRWQVPLQNMVRFVAFGPNDSTIIAANEKTIQVRETKTGKELHRLPLPANSQLFSCALSADGRTLAIGMGHRIEFPGVTIHGAFPEVVLWEMSTGKVRRRLLGHEANITALAFAPDGTLISASQDSTALIWEGPSFRKKTDLSTQEVEDRWGRLGDPDAIRAYDALCDLVSAGGAAVSVLQKVLRPVKAGDTQKVQNLLRDLASDTFSVRQRASRELEALAEGAEPMLRKALEGDLPLEIRRRVEQAIEKLDPLQSAERLRALRAVEVLEWIGSPAAKRLLETLAGGIPGARLTQEARVSLGRLNKKGK